MMEKQHLFALCLFLLQIFITMADPPHLLGGGNFTNGATDDIIEAQFAALNDAGATRCRMNVCSALLNLIPSFSLFKLN
jgi:hypothetical protein